MADTPPDGEAGDGAAKSLRNHDFYVESPDVHVFEAVAMDAGCSRTTDNAVCSEYR